MRTFRFLRLRFRGALVAFILLSFLVVYVYKRRQAQAFFDENFVADIDDDTSDDPFKRLLYDDTGRRFVFPHVTIVRKGATDRLSINRSINTSSGGGGCKLAELRLDDPDLRRFFHSVPPLKCDDGEPNWVFVSNGTFRIDEAAVRRHGDIVCAYSAFWRESDHRTVRGARVANFTDGRALESDFFETNCSAKKATFANIYAAIKPDQKAVERAMKIAAERKLKERPFNVYFLGFDSLSRMTFMRKLPKLVKFLTEELAAVVLKGYNIVGDGTPQALIPILTGKTEVELPLTRKRFSNAQHVNVYPFVWNDYRNAGYVTLYGEDAASIGTFTYRLKGFAAQPTDHYLRTFYTVAEGQYKRHKANCLGREPHHVAFFRYVEHFFDAYADLPKFAFQFHSLLSHDDLNNVELADADVVRHLRKLDELNDTILIVFADHGHRFASLRETQQGKLEERLPFFSVTLPPRLRERFPELAENLRTNAERLTTPFDIYPTLLDFLHLADVDDAARFLERFPVQSERPPRARSLLRPIPAERGCTDAGVEPHWCACLAWEPVGVRSPLIRYIARALVDAINAETLRERANCVVLSLAGIDRAARFRPSTSMLRYKKAKDLDGFEPDLSGDARVSREFFQVVFRTSPGGAHYEASVELDLSVRDAKAKRPVPTGKPEQVVSAALAGELLVDLDAVSHTNKYGQMPHCVIDRDYFLAKWCVCPDMVGKEAER